MANGIATATIAGNLTRDPELNDSGKVLSFGVAVNRREKNRDTDEWEDAPHFFDVKVLGNRAESLNNLLSKGAQVTVTGDLVQERWQDRETQANRSAVRILAREVVLPPKGDGSGEMRDDSKDLF